LPSTARSPPSSKTGRGSQDNAEPVVEIRPLTRYDALIA
jgi:hypothetical protein